MYFISIIYFLSINQKKCYSNSFKYTHTLFSFMTFTHFMNICHKFHLITSF